MQEIQKKLEEFRARMSAWGTSQGLLFQLVHGGGGSGSGREKSGGDVAATSGSGRIGSGGVAVATAPTAPAPAIAACAGTAATRVHKSNGSKSGWRR